MRRSHFVSTLVRLLLVQDTVDDLADYMEDMNEVNEMLGRSYNVGEEVLLASLSYQSLALSVKRQHKH
jgi:hypothetical protein